jgi:hypothetical protein
MNVLIEASAALRKASFTPEEEADPEKHASEFDIRKQKSVSLITLTRLQALLKSEQK